jgi:hypothetical protein
MFLIKLSDGLSSSKTVLADELYIMQEILVFAASGDLTISERKALHAF